MCCRFTRTTLHGLRTFDTDRYLGLHTHFAHCTRVHVDLPLPRLRWTFAGFIRYDLLFGDLFCCCPRLPGPRYDSYLPFTIPVALPICSHLPLLFAVFPAGIAILLIPHVDTFDLLTTLLPFTPPLVSPHSGDTPISDCSSIPGALPHTYVTLRLVICYTQVPLHILVVDTIHNSTFVVPYVTFLNFGHSACSTLLIPCHICLLRSFLGDVTDSVVRLIPLPYTFCSCCTLTLLR